MKKVLSFLFVAVLASAPVHSIAQMGNDSVQVVEQQPSERIVDALLSMNMCKGCRETGKFKEFAGKKYYYVQQGPEAAYLAPVVGGGIDRLHTLKNGESVVRQFGGFRPDSYERATSYVDGSIIPLEVFKREAMREVEAELLRIERQRLEDRSPEQKLRDQRAHEDRLNAGLRESMGRFPYR
jgi:hypothetical protein